MVTWMPLEELGVTDLARLQQASCSVERELGSLGAHEKPLPGASCWLAYFWVST